MSGNISERSRLTQPAGMGPRILPTTAVRGFTRIATCSGAPTGIPAVIPGQIPMVFDSLNKELYVYSGAWIGMSQDFYLEVQKGNIPGHSVIHKFGRNATVANGSWEGVQILSSLFYFPTSATTVRVKAGGNAADTAAGAGAQAVTVEGVDGAGNVVSESIELAGALASSSTTASFFRVNRLYIKDGRAGAYGGANTGIITLENTAGTNSIIAIAAGEGQSQSCIYTIPLAKTGYLHDVRVQADAAKAADFRVFVREGILDASTPFSPVRLKMFFDGVLGQEIETGASALLILPELTDIWVEAEGGGAQTEVSADLEIILVDN